MPAPFDAELFDSEIFDTGIPTALERLDARLRRSGGSFKEWRRVKMKRLGTTGAKT